MTAAFAYLIGRSTRNRLLLQLKRVRNPRYAIAAIVGIAYFVLIFWNHSGNRGSAAASPLLGPVTESLSPLLILMVLSGSWLFKGDRSALAFTEAEVAMLFTAPVTRRALIAYKLVRTQVTIFFSVMIWTLLLRRGATALPAALGALSLWSLFTTISLHRLGAALVRAATVEHGVAGARRNWLPLMALLVFLVIIVMQAGGAHAVTTQRTGVFAFLDQLTALLASAPARTALYPVRLVLAPAFATSAGAWGQAMLPACAILLLHLVWVLRSDTAFEEAAAVASSERARQLEAMRQRRGGVPSPKANGKVRTIRLAPRGAPAVAILWKNTIALMRASTLVVLIGPLLLSFVLAITLPKGRADTAQAVAFVCAIVTAVLMLLGGRALRNDLRSDMLHLSMLKSLPLSGAHLVLAEVASGTIVLTLLQFALLAGAGIATAMSGAPFLPADVRLAILLASPVVLVAFNAATFAILNGTAVLFPAWIRLGPTGPGGIEAMGQQILTTFGTWLTLAILLIVPGFLAWGTLVLAGARNPVGIAAGCVVGAVVLGVETWAVIQWLGRAFERAEPSQVAQ